MRRQVLPALPMVKGEVCAAIGFWSMGRATPVDPLLTLTWYSTDISSPFAAENWKKTRDAKRALWPERQQEHSNQVLRKSPTHTHSKKAQIQSIYRIL